ncbi:MAG TPA: ABC transporter ATP-binding protein [Anaeromyxobacteraceae bacterium]|nr:ABC transporter ATP-binding protein [Anaeromyxobacteraceae bacterium]
MTGLSVQRLEARYGAIQALWGVTFDVPPGEIVAVVGANGAGKTTTLKAISGLVRPTAGAVILDGRPLHGLSTMEIVEAGVVQVPEGRKLFPAMTVEENLLLGGYVRSARPRQRERLERAYAVFPRLAERRRQLAGTLSGGEQQMVAIARGLMAGPRVLMLDEPSLGLAPIVVEEMFRVIVEINRTGVTVLLVEQNTEHALAIAHRGFVLESGRAALSGTGAELLANDRVRQAYLGM